MPATAAMFCAHKRLRTACPECTPGASRPSALRDEDRDFPIARRRRPGEATTRPGTAPRSP